MKNIFVVTIFTAALATMLMMGSPKQKSEFTLSVPYGALNVKAKAQVECLAQNILFEAGQEPIKGQLAVAMVTMRRAQSSAYPDSVCGVVRQKVNNVCQFSWWCDATLKQKAVKYNYSPSERHRLNEIRKVALLAYLNYGEIKDPSNGAMFYHANYVNPGWKLKKTTTIGNHIFYKRS